MKSDMSDFEKKLDELENKNIILVMGNDGCGKSVLANSLIQSLHGKKEVIQQDENEQLSTMENIEYNNK